MDELRSIDDNASAQAEPQRGPFWWRVMLGAMRGFFADRAMAMAASLAFYTMLSFAPLLVVLVWVSTMAGYDARQLLLDQLASAAGPAARNTAATILESARQQPSLGSMAGIASIVLALIGATTVFAQLQASLNYIWGIRARPGRAVAGWLRQRVLSIGVIAAAGFVLIVSLLASAALGFLLPRSGPAWDVLNQVISAAIMALLFAMLFRYLPDARLPWRRVLRGGVITAVLFAIGKWAIGLYLSSGSVGGAYGAAGSLVLLLVWVYYSGVIFFFGAEVVRAWSRECHEDLHLRAHAEPLP